MNTIDLIALNIIREQELIIGPMAWAQAKKVTGLHVKDQKNGLLSIDENNAPSIIDGLVGQYEHLFGRASKEVCKEAASKLISALPQAQIPSSLR